MIRKLTLEEILALLKKTPEQGSYDSKKDFSIPNNDENKGELIKDITAIANSMALSPGFIIYGVDPKKPDPIIGVTNQYDDSRIQQFMNGKVEPFIDFVYYELTFAAKIISVIQIFATRKRPHIIKVDLGKVRNGQIPIRRGSSTDGIKFEDLVEFFYGSSSGYFPHVLKAYGLDVQRMQASIQQGNQLRQMLNDVEKDLDKFRII